MGKQKHKQKTTSREATIIFQGPDMRAIEINSTTEISVNFILDNVVKQANEHVFVIINTHGKLCTVNHHTIHLIQLDDDRKSWAKTEIIFTKLTKSNIPLTVQLFACYASVACTSKIVSELPKGSLVGFYAPRDSVSRMEVSEKLIGKSLELKAQKATKQEILWLTAPLCQTSIAYNNPTNGFQFKDLLFDYKTITNYDDLLRAKTQSLEEYNGFLVCNNLEPVQIEIIQYMEWFKDMWFMQIVIELTSDDTGRNNAAIEYLKDVDDTLKLHETKLASIPKKNLIEYFRAWYDINIARGKSAAKDQSIIEGLELIFKPVNCTKAVSI